MAGIDLSKYLAEVSSASPAGEDLAYDVEYQALFQLAKGKPETQWSGAEDPNWREVRDECGKLLLRTKDVPLVVLLTVALLQTQGLPGLADGLELLRDLLDRYWPGIHPLLDPDDGDATERVNAINALSPPAETFGDGYRVRQRVREAPLAASPRLGRFSWKDMAIATGQLARPTGEAAAPTDERAILAAFDDTPADLLQSVGAAAARGAAACRDVELLVAGHVGESRGVTLTDLRQALVDAAKLVDAQLARRGLGGAGSPGDAAAAAPAAGAAGVGGSAPAAGPAARSAPGEIRSHQDVAAAIDRICDYYFTHEPSSPIPLLLLRARRLVAKSFAEIMRDLSPDALSNLSVISGTDLTADPSSGG
jgi:type VI secretion system protein ImpA